MRVEGAGDARALSHKGAMELMQIMPDTLTMLRQQHGLGDHLYDPRDNILAGAGYLPDLHYRYGEEGFWRPIMLVLGVTKNISGVAGRFRLRHLITSRKSTG